LRVLRLCDGLFEAQLAFHALAPRDEEALDVFVAALGDRQDLVEVETRGASFRQDALASIAGPKEPSGKRFRVGVTLRCEPHNPKDEHAVRVEVMGQLVAYVVRKDASTLAPLMWSNCGGAVESRGLIVGGWKHDLSEGSYGIRVWLTSDDMQRLGRPLS
jgi:hypothetical protein